MARPTAAGALVVLALASSVGCQFLVGLDKALIEESDAATKDSGVSDAAELQDRSTPADVVTPCSADLSSDPANCGVCGHDCLGQACTSGKCAPALSIAGFDDPHGVAIAGSYAFLGTNEGASHRLLGVDLSTKSVASLATGSDTTNGVVVAGSEVIWTAGELYGGGADGGLAALRSLGASNTDQLVADDTTIFATTVDGYLTGTTYGSVIRCARASPQCFVDSFVAPFVAQDSYGALNDWARTIGIADGRDGRLFLAIPGLGVRSVSKTDAQVTLAREIDESIKGTVAVAVESEGLYWINRGSVPGGFTDGELGFRPTGGAAQIRAGGLKAPRALLVAGDYVYVACMGTSPSFADGSIVAFDRKGSSPPIELASGRAGPVAMAIDAQRLYWVERGSRDADGAVMAGKGALVAIARLP